MTLPYSMLEPIREQLDAGLQSDRTEVDDRWTTSLQEEIKEAKINLRCCLIDAELSLRDIVDLKPGDVIPIDLPGSVNLLVEGLPLFRGIFGVSRGKRAIKIQRRIRHAPRLNSSRQGSGT